MNCVVTTYPLLPGLCSKDVDDALEYIGLTALTDWKLVFQPHKASICHDTYLIDHEAGLGSLANYPDNPGAYWDRVRLRLIELPLEDWTKRRVTKVLFLGESALDKEFLQVVEDAMRRLQGDIPTIYQSDPLYIAAEGAAEFAQRAQEDRTQ
ncbi:MAG: hypothetical protein Q9187_007586 [Circinaria calcarea]